MKQRIRLTESDLHRIVKESVNRILKEAYKGGLGPITLANYSYGRARQANAEKDEFKKQQLMDKALQGRYAARDAWNRDYGIDADSRLSDGGRTNSSSSMGVGDDYGYYVDSKYSSFYNDGSNSVHNRRYNPYKDSEDVEVTNTDTSGKQDKFGRKNVEGGPIQYGDYLERRNAGRNVARQMAKGTGNYKNGK